MESWMMRILTLLAGIWCATVSCQGLVTVVVGKKATLRCLLSFSGNPTVMWLDPQNKRITQNLDVVSPDTRYSVERPYQREWRLNIDNVKRADAGEYTCAIQTTPMQFQRVQLDVQVGPNIGSSSDDATRNVGQEIEFSCTATGWPSPVISWYRYDYKAERKDMQVTGQYLRIANMSRHDAATYECEANNGVPPVARAQMRLDILFAPEISIPYGQISQQEGKDTLLECIVTANPHTTLYWAKDGRQLADSGKYRIHEWEVGQYTKNLGAFVYDLVEADYGQYACVASNVHGRDEASVQLYEWHTGHIKVLHTPADAISPRGAGVLFNCTVDGMSHRDSLTWWRVRPGKEPVRIFESHSASSQRRPVYMNTNKYEIRGHYNLVVNSVEAADAGEYMCEVTGHTNYSAFLTVVEEMACDNKIVNGTSVEEGTAAVLECELGFAGPAPVWEVHWQVGEVKLSSVNLDEASRLLRRVAFPAYAKDTGIYTCAVSSKLPAYSGQCTTELDVIRGLPTASPACGVKVSQMSNALMIMGAVAGGIIIMLVIALCYSVIHYRRELRKYTRHGPPSVRYTSVQRNGTHQETSTLMPSRKDLMTASTTPETEGAPILPVRRPLTSQLSEDHAAETSQLLRKESKPALDPPTPAPGPPPPPPTSPPPIEEEEERAPLATLQSLDEATC